MSKSGGSSGDKGPYVSRAGMKLAHALSEFGIHPAGWVCADLGCNVGGFTDCLLKAGASAVYAVDTGYGILDYRLRKDPRVRVMERTNALHAAEAGVSGCDLVVVDVAWTKQAKILPAAKAVLAAGSIGHDGPEREGPGRVITLIKPHYERPAAVKQGLLDEAEIPAILDDIRRVAADAGFKWVAETVSPIRGEKAGNIEVLALLEAQE